MKKQVFESCARALDDSEFYGEEILTGITGLPEPVASEDWKRCDKVLADWMRARPKPQFCPYDDHTTVLLGQDHINRANDILKGLFTLPDSKGGFITESLKGEFEWSPAYAPGNTYHPPKMFRYHLNQHEPLSSLAEVYNQTTETQYRDRILTLLMDWIRRVPTYWKLLQSNECERQHWQNMMTRNRFEKWLDIFPLISAVLSDRDAVDLMKAMVHHAWLMDEYVGQHMGSGISGTLVGMIKVNLKFATLFPETRMARQAASTFKQHFRTGIETMFYPDGGLKYCCTGYHRAVSAWYVQAVGLSKGLSIGEIDHEREMVWRMQTYSARLMKPDGNVPLLGDTGVNIMAGSETDWRKKLLNEMDPDTPSQALKWSGAYAMRSGWETDDLYLFFNAGPHGTMHNHQDYLSLEVSGFGKPLIVEPGITPYGRAEQRNQLISSPAHNTLTVDGYGQHRAHLEPTEPSANPWHTSPEFDYVEGTFDEGFGPDQSLKVTHTRSVLFIKDEYFLVIDRLTGDGLHDVRWHYMFYPQSLELGSDGTSVHSNEVDGPNVAFFWSDPELSAEIIQGETVYPYRGLMTSQEDRETSSLILEARACLPSSTAFLIEPFREEKGSVMTLSRMEAEKGVAVMVEHPDGKDVVMISPTVSGDLRTDGVATVFRSRSDQYYCVLAYGGTSVTVGGVPVADMDISISWH